MTARGQLGGGMSKKLYSTARWKRYLESRGRSELKKLRRRRRSLRGQPRRSRTTRRGRPFSTIYAPPIFSMKNNPEGAITFLRAVLLYAKNNNLMLDLGGITEITTDAIAALIATIRPIFESTVIRGNFPSNAACRDTLVQSGFFKYVRVAKPLPACKKGMIANRESKKVEPRIARDLIHLGMEGIYGSPRPCQPAYRAIIESMNNTHNHAAGKKALRELWWLTVYADPARGCVSYTFLDTGVGILGSVRFGFLRRAYKLVGLTDDARILRDILEGKVESSTGMPYRGKGLPAIHKLSQEGRITSLVIVANDVYANVDARDYRVLSRPFRGTLLYWETWRQGAVA